MAVKSSVNENKEYALRMLLGQQKDHESGRDEVHSARCGDVSTTKSLFFSLGLKFNPTTTTDLNPNAMKCENKRWCKH